MGPLSRNITAGFAVAALAFGGAGVAQAKHGSDDPVKEVRGGKRADDVKPHARHGADDAAGHRRHARHKRHRHAGDDHGRHGADDGAGHR
jgi:hypothetical protein